MIALTLPTLQLNEKLNDFSENDKLAFFQVKIAYSGKDCIVLPLGKLAMVLI